MIHDPSVQSPKKSIFRLDWLSLNRVRSLLLKRILGIGCETSGLFLLPIEDIWFSPKNARAVVFHFDAADDLCWAFNWRRHTFGSVSCWLRVELNFVIRQIFRNNLIERRSNQSRTSGKWCLWVRKNREGYQWRAVWFGLARTPISTHDCEAERNKIIR